MQVIMHEGLTEKQLSFAVYICSGMPMAMAYAKAYDAENMSNASINAAASTLMDHPKVSSFIHKAMNDRVAKSIATNRMWVRQFIIDRSMMEAIDEDNPAAARLKALELLGKATGVGEEIVVNHDKRALSEVEALLRSKLNAMVKTIEGPTPITNADSEAVE